MPNFTNLPERHFVDKAKRLSLGDKDSDVYFDGEALEALINTVEDLQEQIEHLPTESFTTMTITHIDGASFQVDADYAELVKAIRERSPILAKVYDRSISSAVTNYSLSSSTTEKTKEFIIVGQEIVMGANSVTVNQITVSFPPINAALSPQDILALMGGNSVTKPVQYFNRLAPRTCLLLSASPTILSLNLNMISGNQIIYSGILAVENSTAILSASVAPNGNLFEAVITATMITQ